MMGYVAAFRQLGYEMRNPRFVSAEKSDAVALAIFRSELDQHMAFDSRNVPGWDEQRRRLGGNTVRKRHIARTLAEFDGKVDVVLVYGGSGGRKEAEPWRRTSSLWQVTYFDEESGHHRVELKHDYGRHSGPKVYLPSQGPADWQRLLADPVKHWRAGYSAMALANCWEAAQGLPPEIATLVQEIGPNPELLVALPEHKVPLPGSTRGASQTDLFALARAGEQTVAVAVEGKVDESFGPVLGDWLKDASPGKLERLAYICDLLGLDQPLPNSLRYQLLHRTASAMIEARRFKTDAAAMIVHSFSPKKAWFEDYAAFVALFGLEAKLDQLICVRPVSTPPLYLGWAIGPERFLLE